MRAKELIVEVPVIQFSDTIATALKLMNDQCAYDLPVLQDGMLVGVLSGETVSGTDDQNTTIRDLKDDLYKLFVNADQHVLDVVYVAGLQETTIIPVIAGTNDNHYLGIIRLQDLVRELSNGFSFSLPGGIITLSMDTRDFQLSEISRIVESNDVRILSMLTDFSNDGNRINVTLKLNIQDMKHITATFERFGYQTTLYFDDPFRAHDLKDRYDYLMRFLKM